MRPICGFCYRSFKENDDILNVSSCGKVFHTECSENRLTGRLCFSPKCDKLCSVRLIRAFFHFQNQETHAEAPTEENDGVELAKQAIFELKQAEFRILKHKRQNLRNKCRILKVNQRKNEKLLCNLHEEMNTIATDIRKKEAKLKKIRLDNQKIKTDIKDENKENNAFLTENI